ncbi:hypothetical protein Poli38472_000400 [Pythium oligandrum]|uniref:RING-type domain-containing protein n=1 Tax=Pythium oligandrum TaxID=41045 RepID=A0A8K1FJ37_PYTOL|nr:hypothetical protein Poli38472_000400 [Pythium oligandrum]|eukprot:TMW60358.1 hypothetical protein Poli38472_000400 [Pythium oligandrum]
MPASLLDDHVAGTPSSSSELSDDEQDEEVNMSSIWGELNPDFTRNNQYWDSVSMHHNPNMVVVALPTYFTHANTGAGSNSQPIDLDDAEETTGNGPGGEIDLTVSSDSEGGSDNEQGSRPANEDRDDDDDDVEIIETNTSTTAAPPSTSSVNRPLNRKRRRRSASSSGAATTSENPLPFDTKGAESTNISIENAEVIERFKKSLKCSICLDVIQDMTSTICGHVYCGNCIRLAIRVTRKCPLCQRPLRPKDIHGLYF